MQSVKSKQKQNKILSNEMQNVLQVSDADPRSVGVKEKKNRTPVSAVRHVVYECHMSVEHRRLLDTVTGLIVEVFVLHRMHINYRCSTNVI
jgi:hypothetical protein